MAGLLALLIFSLLFTTCVARRTEDIHANRSTVGYSIALLEDHDNQSNCSTDMFGGENFAYWACLAEDALQQNWYPSPIAGLFSYQSWNGFDGFWQNGAVLETLVNFMDYAKHQRYKTVALGSLRDLSSLLEAYYPQPSYDDMGWYGLSYLRIYEVFNEGKFLEAAQGLFDWNWKNGWDSSNSCDGGMWFDQQVNGKVTITNVQMLHLGAKLYVLSGKNNTELLHKINKTWNFITKNGIVDPKTYRVADGIFLENCTSNENFGPTYSPGVLAAGLIYFADISNDEAYLDMAHRIVNATMVYDTQDGVLTEPCDFTGCGNDNIVFKGIFVRNLRYLMDKSDKITREKYQSWLSHNVDVLMKNSSCWDQSPKICPVDYSDGPPFFPFGTPVFGTNWHGPYNYSSPMQQASALDLLVSSITPGTQCHGPGCLYDPPDSPCAASLM